MIVSSAAAQNTDGRYLIEVARTAQLEGFRTGDYFPFMLVLSKKYGEDIAKDFDSLLHSGEGGEG